MNDYTQDGLSDGLFPAKPEHLLSGKPASLTTRIAAIEAVAAHAIERIRAVAMEDGQYEGLLPALPEPLPTCKPASVSARIAAVETAIAQIVAWVEAVGVSVNHPSFA